MAGVITFTSKTGSGSTFVLHPSEAAAVAAGGNLFWEKIQVGSPSPWSFVPYPGFRGLDAKWMSGKPHVFAILGFATAATEALLFAAVNALLNQNKDQNTFAISGAISSASGDTVFTRHHGRIAWR